MLTGLGLVIASACVFNNYLDRDIDKKMERTRTRALASGRVTARNVILFASLLGISGILVLSFLTNQLTTVLALLAFFFYVVIYAFFKRKSVHGTIVGSIPGAAPPVIGYCAVTNTLDASAIILFLILVLWQMPHFYAIAMYRSKDYAAASIPVLPLVKDIRTTKMHILLYILAFTFAAVSLSFFGKTGYVYAVIGGISGIYWLSFGVKGLKTEDDNLWAKQMFVVSLIVITLLCVTISAESFFL